MNDDRVLVPTPAPSVFRPAVEVLLGPNGDVMLRFQKDDGSWFVAVFSPHVAYEVARALAETAQHAEAITAGKPS
jgi:hypothetical protein